MTRRRRLGASMVALAALVLTGCDNSEPSVPPSAREAISPDEWKRAPDLPLSPRLGPVVAAVHEDIVVVGGDEGPPCPPGADCASPGAPTTDGAVYDPSERTWRPIAPAPRPIGDSARHAVAGPWLFVLDDRGLQVYDVVEDSWTTQQVPGGHLEWRALSSDRERHLVVASSSDERVDLPDYVLDVATGRWSRLPADPLGTSFDRVLTATPEGLVLTARRILSNGQPADPACVHAALLPPHADRWRVLPRGDLLGGGRWSWTGRTVADFSPGGADGGEVDGYGRTIPYGGQLDLMTRTWSPLTVDGEPEPGWPVEAVDGASAVAAGYSFQSGRWLTLPPPDGGPDEPGPAAWASTRLVVVGGVDPDAGDSADEVYSTQVWWIYL